MKGSQIKIFKMFRVINQGTEQNQKAGTEQIERVHFEIRRHVEQQGSAKEVEPVGDNILRDLLQGIGLYNCSRLLDRHRPPPPLHPAPLVAGIQNKASFPFRHPGLFMGF